MQYSFAKSSPFAAAINACKLPTIIKPGTGSDIFLGFKIRSNVCKISTNTAKNIIDHQLTSLYVDSNQATNTVNEGANITSNKFFSFSIK